MSKRVLVVDDDRKLVRLVGSYLEKAGFVVLSAYDGDTAMHAIRSERPDLVVLDLMLPGHDGWEIARWMREDDHLAAIPVLMLTARVEDADKLRGFDLGADDYVTKPFNPSEVVARVQAIIRRVEGKVKPSNILVSGALRLDLDARTASLNAHPLDLTPTEIALLQILMQHPNRTFTRSELIEAALGFTYEGMERTLDSHIKNLRKKIEADPGAPRYIETVFGVGYRFHEAE